MANYEEQTRSNYFKVKDVEKFKELLDEHYLTFIQLKGTDLVGFLAEDGLPAWDRETDEEIDFMDLVSKHLVKGDVAIIIGNGFEKMRYLTGFAAAVNSRGTAVYISVEDIYKKAEKLTKTPKNITRCEY